MVGQTTLNFPTVVLRHSQNLWWDRIGVLFYLCPDKDRPKDGHRQTEKAKGTKTDTGYTYRQKDRYTDRQSEKEN